MARTSAGLLLHRTGPDGLEVLLVHPGGPFWAKKDLGAWSIPKGEHGPDDDPLATAEREFAEELGSPPPARSDADLDLGTIRQSGGKVVHGFARAGDLDADAITSNAFECEWPPRSGRMQTFPEVDRAAWFALAEARERINAAQAELLERLQAELDAQRDRR
jgi:predicted NUDIX family NTP pyrophosphohydrolase